MNKRKSIWLLDIGHGLQIWYRTWGNKDGIPILFVHGGPGNVIADYYNGNKRFFDYTRFYVVEIDQRGLATVNQVSDKIGAI